MREQDRADELAGLSRAARTFGIDAARVVLPRDAHVVLRGLRFHYLDWGNEAMPTIILLHGGGLTAHTFDLVALSLRDRYHCLALDQRGHGDSEWSPVMDYRISTHAADIAAFVNVLVPQRFAIVGMSMGGLNALKYAGSRPTGLAALVLIDIGPDIQDSGAARIRGFMAEQKDLDSIDDYIERALVLNPRRDPHLLRRSLLHNLRRTPDGKWAWKWDPRPRQSEGHRRRRAEERATLWEDVRHVACPTLVVRGEESDVFSQPNADTLTARLEVATQVTVPAAGHSVQGDNPIGLARELRGFLHRIGFQQ